jgi:glutathione S-transferase
MCLLGIAGYDARTEYPKIAAWMERVHQDLSPHYDEAHHILNKMAMKSQL